MKNKYQEAFNFLFNYEVLHKNVPNVGRATKGSFELECWNNLKELVDKETPMKVICEGDDWYKYDCYCPKCKALMMISGASYCWRCGQKLSYDGLTPKTRSDE